MRAIIPARLWIGNIGDLDSPREILNAGVRAVVQLSREEFLADVAARTCCLPFSVA